MLHHSIECFIVITKDKVPLYVLIWKGNQNKWLSEERKVCTNMCIENFWKDTKETISSGYL